MIFGIVFNTRSEICWVIQACCGDDERANARVEDSVDFETVSANVLILRKKDPVPGTNDWQELDIHLAGELIEWTRVVAFGLEPKGNTAA